jgi:hypothetical protein
MPSVSSRSREAAPESTVDFDPPDRRRESTGHTASRIQSGTLTAGSFDDHERFDDYREFLAKAMQNDTAERLPRMAVGRRVMIHVTNSSGKPVGDARVVVRPASSQQPISGDAVGDRALLDLTTGSDGRVLFLTGADAGGGADEFQLVVHPLDGSEPVVRTVHLDQAPWRIALPAGPSERPNRLDLALVIDTTGSMSDELEYLKVEIDSIARAIHRQFPNVDQRYALVVYRDEGDEYVTRTFDFTGSLDEFRAVLAGQSADGGGDNPEAMHLAMESATRLDWRGRQTARVAFLVADAPPHDSDANRTLEAVAELRHRGVRVFPVAGSGVAMKAEFVMRASAFLTLGQYLFLTDHSGVGNPHARPHVPDYQVERLDRLMIRMIASELAGRHLAADEVIAIERGGGTVPLDEPPLPEQQQSNDLTHSPAASQGLRSPAAPRWVWLVAALLGLCFLESAFDRGGAKLWNHSTNRPSRCSTSMITCGTVACKTTRLH